MISLTIIPEQSNPHKQKQAKKGDQSIQYPRVRFSSLKEISNITVGSSKVVPLQFTTSTKDNKLLLQDPFANAWDFPYKVESKGKDDFIPKSMFQAQPLHLKNHKQRQKKAFSENLDDELAQFKAKSQPIENDYVRVYYQKLALESYIQEMKNPKKANPYFSLQDRTKPT